jgi:hypothetical protein
MFVHRHSQFPLTHSTQFQPFHRPGCGWTAPTQLACFAAMPVDTACSSQARVVTAIVDLFGRRARLSHILGKGSLDDSQLHKMAKQQEAINSGLSPTFSLAWIMSNLQCESLGLSQLCSCPFERGSAHTMTRSGPPASTAHSNVSTDLHVDTACATQARAV